jgi:hypothetical protein
MGSEVHKIDLLRLRSARPERREMRTDSQVTEDFPM